MTDTEIIKLVQLAVLEGMTGHPALMRFAQLVAAHRQWVGLTDEEIFECDPQQDCWNLGKIARTIEARLKEKNYD